MTKRRPHHKVPNYSNVQFTLIDECEICGKETHQFDVSSALLTGDELLNSGYSLFREIRRISNHVDLVDCIKYLRHELRTHEHGKAYSSS